MVWPLRVISIWVALKGRNSKMSLRRYSSALFFMSSSSALSTVTTDVFERRARRRCCRPPAAEQAASPWRSETEIHRRLRLVRGVFFRSAGEALSAAIDCHLHRLETADETFDRSEVGPGLDRPDSFHSPPSLAIASGLPRP